MQTRTRFGGLDYDIRSSFQVPEQLHQVGWALQEVVGCKKCEQCRPSQQAPIQDNGRFPMRR